MLKKIIKFLFSIFVIVLLLDPADKIFHLKTPIFLLILFIWAVKFFLSKSKIIFFKDIFFIILTFGIITFFGIIVSLLQNSDIDYEFVFGFIKSLSILFLLFVIIDLDMLAISYLNKYSILIPLVTFPIYLIVLFDFALLDQIFDFLVTQKKSAMLATRSYYGYDVIMVYYKTSPVLVFPLAFFLDQFVKGEKKYKSFILSFVFFISLLISGTRANMISAVLITLYFLYILVKERKNIVYKIFLIIAVSILGLYFFSKLSFNESESSTVIKTGHFDSFTLNLKNNPQYLIWGQGLGSKFYSKGIDDFTAQTELTYFDLIRFFGLPLSIIFMLLIIYPMAYYYFNNKITLENRYLLIAFIFYLFIAGTNPLLISSTGMLVLISMFSVIRQNKIINNYSL
jgi:hypothetical protein